MGNEAGPLRRTIIRAAGPTALLMAAIVSPRIIVRRIVGERTLCGLRSRKRQVPKPSPVLREREKNLPFSFAAALGVFAHLIRFFLHVGDPTAKARGLHHRWLLVS